MDSVARWDLLVAAMEMDELDLSLCRGVIRMETCRPMSWKCDAWGGHFPFRLIPID